MASPIIWSISFFKAPRITRAHSRRKAPSNRWAASADAVTSRDMIRFQASAPSAQVEVLVKVLADIVQAPTLDAHSFARERPTILAEIQQKDDNPLNALFNHAYELTYRAHPYRYAPTGTIDDVLGLLPTRCRRFTSAGMCRTI